MFIMSEINVKGERRNEKEQNEKEDTTEDKKEEEEVKKEEDKKEEDKKEEEEVKKEEDKEEDKKEDKKEEVKKEEDKKEEDKKEEDKKEDEDGKEKENKKEKDIEIKKNTVEKVDTINDDNVICLCVKNILTSTFEKDSEHFWTEKTRELKNFIAKNTKSNEFENEEWDDEVLPTNIIMDSWNEVRHKNEIVNTNSEEEKSLLQLGLEKGEEEMGEEKKEETEEEEEEEEMEKETEKEKEKKKIQRKNRKRNYIDIEKVHFDFDDKDFAMNENDKFINVNYFNEFEKHVSEYPKWDNITTNNNSCNINWDGWINLEDESVKSIITPPKIPLNETFRKINKEINELYIKSEKGTKNKQEMNIFVKAQLKCLETIESIEREHSSISEHFDKAIMEKLQITKDNEMESTDVSNKQNENLTKLLEYMMSWYFAGFYIGRMSAQKL